MWRPLFGGKYWVSRCGHVWSSRTKALMSLQANHHGYLRVWLYDTERCKHVYRVHHLVLWVFGPGQPDGAEVDHLDKNRLNNCIKNLEWVSRQENMRRKHQEVNHG